MYYTAFASVVCLCSLLQFVSHPLGRNEAERHFDSNSFGDRVRIHGRMLTGATHRRRNRGRGAWAPDKGTQYDRGPLTFEKCRPIFELKVTPYFQS